MAIEKIKIGELVNKFGKDGRCGIGTTFFKACQSGL